MGTCERLRSHCRTAYSLSLSMRPGTPSSSGDSTAARQIDYYDGAYHSSQRWLLRRSRGRSWAAAVLLVSTLRCLSLSHHTNGKTTMCWRLVLFSFFGCGLSLAAARDAKDTDNLGSTGFSCGFKCDLLLHTIFLVPANSSYLSASRPKTRAAMWHQQSCQLFGVLLVMGDFPQQAECRRGGFDAKTQCRPARKRQDAC